MLNTYSVNWTASPFIVSTFWIITGLVSTTSVDLILPEMRKETCWFVGSLFSAASWTLAVPASITVSLSWITPDFLRAFNNAIPAACLSLASFSFPPSLLVFELEAPPLTKILSIELNAESIAFNDALPSSEIVTSFASKNLASGGALYSFSETSTEFPAGWITSSYVEASTRLPPPAVMKDAT
jgi:hypothetical protein